jgi:hypothetical protein
VSFTFCITADITVPAVNGRFLHKVLPVGPGCCVPYCQLPVCCIY